MSAHSAKQIDRRAKPAPVAARNRGKNYPWTEERIKFAVDGVRDGLSAVAVARAIEKKWPDDGKPTRNAVIGKVYRVTRDQPHQNRFVVFNNKPRPINQRVQKINSSIASKTNRTLPTAVNFDALPVSDVHQLSDPSKAAARNLGPLADPQTGLPYGVTTIRRGMCHYPIGDPYKPGFGYCGRSAYVRKCSRPGEDDVTPYCNDHRLLVYDKNKSRRRDAEIKKINRRLPKSLRN